MSKIFIKPRKPEFIVFKPDGRRLKSEGEYVEAVTFWHRRLKDKDVIVIKPPKTPATSPAAQPADAVSSTSTAPKGK